MIWVNSFFSIIVIILLLLFILPHYHARKMRGLSAPNIEHLLNDTLKKSKRLLIYFWSPNCSACAGMSETVDDLIKSNKALIKINAQANLEITKKFRVVATPSLVVLKDNKIERMLVGFKSQRDIMALL